MGKVDPISRSDNTTTYTTPSYSGLTARVGYKFGKAVGNFNTGSSKFIGVVYDGGELTIHAAYQNTDSVVRGANTTKLAGIIVPTGLESPTFIVQNVFLGGMCDFGFI